MIFPFPPLLPIGHQPPRIERQVLQAGNFRVRVARDVFAKTTVCTVRAGGMEVHNAGVVFKLGGGTDTSAAVYRIDGAEPHDGVGPHGAYRLGVHLGSGSLANPSGGFVAIPLADLAGARTVEVQARRGDRPRRFDVSHVGEAVLAARSAGCPDRPFT